MMYDILTIIFRHIYPQYHEVPWKTLDEMKHERPSEEVIDAHYDFAERYFKLLASAFPEVAEVFEGRTPAKAVEKHRVETGGSVLFRPLGQRMYAQIVAELSKSNELDDIFGWLSLLPTQLDKPPYADVIWDTGTKTITSSKTDAGIVRDVLLYMLGEESRYSLDELKSKYAKYLGQDEADIGLPTPVVVIE